MRTASRRWSRRGSAGIRFAALVLLSVIMADVMADARCDGQNTPVAANFVARAYGTVGSGEPCASVCVPDCFCCSRSTGAAETIAPPRPVPLAALDAPARERWPQGVRPVIDRPPLLLS